MIVTLAKAKAGHDKNHIYVIAGEEGDRVLLVNGETKPLSCPKQKKRIHIQSIKKLPEEIIKLTAKQEVLSDELVVEILALYRTHLSSHSQMSN